MTAVTIVFLKFNPGPSLNISRSSFSCGLLKWKNYHSNQLEKIIVVAGGENDKDFVLSVELLYLPIDYTKADKWIIGPPFPKSVKNATMIEYDNSVILIGGRGAVDGFHMYQLSSPYGPWVEMKQTLRKNRMNHVSFLVPDELVQCHQETPGKCMSSPLTRFREHSLIFKRS